MTRFACALVLALAGALMNALPAAADRVVEMQTTGGPANRLDLVILGDGYRSSEMATFASDARAFQDAFFGHEPFTSYRKFFNVLRIETASAVSGAGTGTPKNTAFRAYFGCFGIDRLLCIDEARVKAKLDAELAANRHDLVIILVNSKTYGGSGGTYAVASTNAQSGDVAIHEFGHSFGHLDDEYVDTASCGRYTDPWGFNVTEATARPSIPWTHWIRSSTPLPTPDLDTRVGLFEGAFYCAKDWYRPTYQSMMQTLGLDFGAVNSEQLVRRMYEFVDPIDRAKPRAERVRIGRNTVTFRLKPIDPALDSNAYVWRLDGRIISRERSVEIRRADLKGRTVKLVATLRDATDLVRKDRKGDLAQSRTWTLVPD